MANKKKKPVDEAAPETPTEEANGGEAQAAATTEVKTHAQVVEDAKAAEAANAPDADAKGSEDLEAAKVDEGHAPDAETELAAPGSDGPGPAVGMGDEPDDDQNRPEQEEKAKEDPALSLEQLQKREACLVIIGEIRDVNEHNHMRPQDWWVDRLSTLHTYIINT